MAGILTLPGPGPCRGCTLQARATHRCFQCARNICDRCAEMHTVLKVFEGHRVAPFGGDIAEAVSECPKHREEFSLFCTDPKCLCFICNKCTAPGEDHEGHSYGSFVETAVTYRQELNKRVAPIEQLNERVLQHISYIESCKGELRSQRQQMSEKIQAMLRSMVTSCLQEYQAFKYKSEKEEAKVLDKHQKELKEAGNELQDHLMSVNSLVQSATDQGVLAVRSQRSPDIEGLIDSLMERHGHYEADESQYYGTKTQLPTPQQVVSFIMEHTKVAVITPPDPNRCTYEGPQVAESNKEISCRVLVMDNKGHPCNTSHDVSIIFKSPADDVEIERKMVNISVSEYHILFTPIVRGRYKMRVMVNGTPIAGNPFIMLVTLPPKKMGIKGPVKVIPNMDRPTRLSFIRDAGFAVSESSGKQVRLMKITGEQVGTVQYEAELTGLEHDEDGCMYVVANTTSELVKFKPDGERIIAVGSVGSGPGQFCNPAGVCIHNNEVIVVDSDNNRLQFFNRDLEFIREFHGDERFPLLKPQGVSFDISGAMYVANTGSRCIQKFQNDKLILIFGMDRMQSPMGVHVVFDGSGKYILVLDYDGNAVFVFDINGKYVHSFGGEGSDAGQFRNPTGLAMDGDGYLWVCDTLNNRLQVF